MKDNIPAFPVHEDLTAADCMKYKGMTLLDYFAGQALMGLCSKYALSNPSDQQVLAQMSYELANAMLTERSKHTNI